MKRWMEKTDIYEQMDGKDRSIRNYGWKRQIYMNRWMK